MSVNQRGEPTVRPRADRQTNHDRCNRGAFLGCTRWKRADIANGFDRQTMGSNLFPSAQDGTHGCLEGSEPNEKDIAKKEDGGERVSEANFAKTAEGEGS